MILLFVLVAFNAFVSRKSIQIDFTKEKRYTLTQSTENLLRNVNDPVQIYVFLQDEQLPSHFKRLQTATRSLLDNYRKISGGRVQYRFENPLKGFSAEEQNEILVDLQQRGISPTNVRIKTKNGFSENLIFPGALVEYGGKQFPVQLLTGQRGQSDINRSLELLEFNFANAISKLMSGGIGQVGFAQGNGELSGLETEDFRQALAYNYYQSRDLNLHEIDSIPQSVNVLVVAKPEQPFSEAEKFKIDQYIMNGGKVIWAIDMMKMNLDSLRTVWGGRNVAVDFNLNLDDQLFKYGARINRNFTRDLQSKPIPVVVDENGQTQLFPWTFFPVVSGGEDHITTENLNPVSLEFVSTIDTVGTPNIEKTILLESSENAGVVANPVLIDLEELRSPPPNSAFVLQNLPMAVLLEGEFSSLYEYRSAPVENWQQQRKDVSKPTKQVVISDGDVLRNTVLPNGQTLPLGFDKNLGEQFGNKEFLINLVDYLANENNVLEARNKQVEMRLLNQTKVEEQKGKWQLLSFLIPILFLTVICSLFYFIRKWRFAR